jgi:hypothetical protein
MTQKSANQLYRESGSTLSFKEWIEREKSKGVHIPNVEANAEMMNMMGGEQQTDSSKDRQKIIIRNVAFILALGTLAFFAYKTITKSKNE